MLIEDAPDFLIKLVLFLKFFCDEIDEPFDQILFVIRYVFFLL